MTEYIPLALFVLVPLLLVIILKTNAALLFFCVAAATLLERFVDPDAAMAANSMLPNTNIDYLSLAILIIPIIITSLVFKGTVKPASIFLHIAIAICTGLTLGLVASTFFPSSVASMYERSDAWKYILDYQTIIVGTGFMLSVLSFALTKPHGDKHKKH